MEWGGHPGWWLGRPSGPCSPSSFTRSTHSLQPSPHRECRGWTSGKAGHRLRETFWVLSLHPVRMETQAQLKRDLQKRLPLPPKSSEPLPTRALGVARVATLPSFSDPEESTGAGQAQRPSSHRGFVSPPISCPAPGLQEQPSLQTGGVSAAGTAPVFTLKESWGQELCMLQRL